MTAEATLGHRTNSEKIDENFSGNNASVHYCLKQRRGRGGIDKSKN